MAPRNSFMTPAMTDEIALITDVHFDVRNGSKFFLDKYEAFFSEIFFPEIKKRGIKHLLILGDVWEYRTKLSAVSLHRALKMFYDRLEAEGIQVYMIYGNHDVAYRNTNEVNLVDFIGKMYDNVHVVKTAETIDINGTPINMVSWINNANLQENLEFIASCPPTILCGHFEINSFEMHKGHLCETGLDKKIFDRFDMVFSGHFHTVSNDGRIFYLSNPFQTNWGDYGQKKGFWTLDLKTRAMEHIQNTFDVYDKIIYTDDLDIVDYDYTQHADKIVRVYVQSYATTNRNKLDLFLEKLSFVSYTNELMEIDDTVTIDSDGNIEFVDNRQLIEAYVNDFIQNDAIDKAKLLNMFTEMYEEALNMVETE